MFRPRRREPGFGLVELMLALLIGGVATLGLATSRLAAGHGLAEARHHSRATLLATDMLHRLQANPGQLADYLVEGLGDPGQLPALARDCRVAACTPGELARFDLHQGLRQLVEADLPVDTRLCLRQTGARLVVAVVWGGRGRVPGVSTADCPAATPDGTGQQLSLVSWLGEAP